MVVANEHFMNVSGSLIFHQSASLASSRPRGKFGRRNERKITVLNYFSRRGQSLDVDGEVQSVAKKKNCHGILYNTFFILSFIFPQFFSSNRFNVSRMFCEVNSACFEWYSYRERVGWPRKIRK